MKTPAFWQTRNLLSGLLVPVSLVYNAVAGWRRGTVTPETLSVPVICVGNLIAGGAGKTPTALYIGHMLKQKNIRAFFLSRGYGGSEEGPLLVNPRLHTARDVGDESLLLASVLPTIVARDRKTGAQFALVQGAKAIVMDDGFQNAAIAKTLSLLIIDGTIGMGNGRYIPAGPLRESPESGFSRADAVIVVNAPKEIAGLPADKPVLHAKTLPADAAQALTGKRVLAFCGLAWPQKFSATLAALGVDVAQFETFPDHYHYSDADIRKLATKAEALDAILVTTAKDAVRLSPAWRSRVNVVDIALVFNEPGQMETLLDEALKSA